MPAPFRSDLRSRIGQAIEAGDDVKTIAARFDVSERTVRRFRQCLHAAGSLAPRPNRGRPRQVLLDPVALQEQLVAHPTATLVEHCQLWTERVGQRVSTASMWRAIRRLGWTRKKERWQPGNTTTRSGLPGAMA